MGLGPAAVVGVSLVGSLVVTLGGLLLITCGFLVAAYRAVPARRR